MSQRFFTSNFLLRLIICGLFWSIIFSGHLAANPSYASLSEAMELLGVTGSDEDGGAILSLNTSENVRVIPLDYLNPNDALGNLRTLFPHLIFTADKRGRRVLFRSDSADYREVLDSVSLMDKPLAQVTFDVEIVEVSTEVLDDYKGILSDIGSGFQVNYDFDSNSVLAVDSLRGTLSRLVKNGDAKVLAKPSISSLDNHPAHIKIGDEIPYTTTIVNNGSQSQQVSFITTGIEIDILPHVASSNHLSAHIISKISSVKLWKEFHGQQYPILSTRKAETDLFLSHNTPLVIAGLFDETQQTRESRIPILSKLPILGPLFRSKRTETLKSDILFLITPKIKVFD